MARYKDQDQTHHAGHEVVGTFHLRVVEQSGNRGHGFTLNRRLAFQLFRNDRRAIGD